MYELGVFETFKTLIVDVKFVDSDCGCVWCQYVIQDMKVYEKIKRRDEWKGRI